MFNVIHHLIIILNICFELIYTHTRARAHAPHTHTERESIYSRRH